MKKLLFAIFTMGFMAIFTACYSGSTPSSAALKIINAHKEKNYEYILDNTVKKDGSHFTTKEKEELTALITEKSTDQKIIIEAKVISEEINEAGDEAKVKMNLTYDNDKKEEVIYDMKKVDEKWQNIEDK